MILALLSAVTIVCVSPEARSSVEAVDAGSPAAAAIVARARPRGGPVTDSAILALLKHRKFTWMTGEAAMTALIALMDPANEWTRFKVDELHGSHPPHQVAMEGPETALLKPGCSRR